MEDVGHGLRSAGGQVSWLGAYGGPGAGFTDLAPGGELDWLEPGKGLWVRADGDFELAPPRAERVFPYTADSPAPFVGSGGAGVAGFWPRRYDEYTFESAGFDIDRPPLSCYGAEDTDAWDSVGELYYEGGLPWYNGEIDQPAEGRHRMLINIGTPITGSSSGNGMILNMGGLGTFLASNRPDVDRSHPARPQSAYVAPAEAKPK